MLSPAFFLIVCGILISLFQSLYASAKKRERQLSASAERRERQEAKLAQQKQNEKNAKDIEIITQNFLHRKFVTTVIKVERHCDGKYLVSFLDNEFKHRKMVVR